mmetsp:Transcript_3267/g.12540  ORF Transcript_3267/g.12540 Transcript_3267/m.12540 type:complete len:225 (+) Transcript_3267:1044-1718(+)
MTSLEVHRCADGNQPSAAIVAHGRIATTTRTLELLDSRRARRDDDDDDAAAPPTKPARAGCGGAWTTVSDAEAAPGTTPPPPYDDADVAETSEVSEPSSLSRTTAARDVRRPWCWYGPRRDDAVAAEATRRRPGGPRSREAPPPAWRETKSRNWSNSTRGVKTASGPRPDKSASRTSWLCSCDSADRSTKRSLTDFSDEYATTLKSTITGTASARPAITSSSDV